MFLLKEMVQQADICDVMGGVVLDIFLCMEDFAWSC